MERHDQLAEWPRYSLQETACFQNCTLKFWLLANCRIDQSSSSVVYVPFSNVQCRKSKMATQGRTWKSNLGFVKRFLNTDLHFWWLDLRQLHSVFKSKNLIWLVPHPSFSRCLAGSSIESITQQKPLILCDLLLGLTVLVFNNFMISFLAIYCGMARLREPWKIGFCAFTEQPSWISNLY